jgi:hypothetical protein
LRSDRFRERRKLSRKQSSFNHSRKEPKMYSNRLGWIAKSGLALFLLLAGTSVVSIRTQAQGNPNPGVVPNKGSLYGNLSAQWWQWALSFPVAGIPFLNTGGPVDISAGQSGHVWFLAGANFGLTGPRIGVVPAGVSLFLPLANLINDYPCPASFNFEPDPGETLEHFLQRTGNAFIPQLTDLFAEIDGVPLRGLSAYRSTSSLFTFKADPALREFFDPCITGEPQAGVSVGYYLLLTPLTPGEHTLHFGAPSWGQDITYVLTVEPGR